MPTETKCPRCAGTELVSLDPDPPEGFGMLSCDTCGHLWSETIRQQQERIDSAAEIIRDLLDLIQPATGRERARVENANTWLRGEK